MGIELVAQGRELGLLRGRRDLGDAPLLADRGLAGIIDVEQDHVHAEHQDVVEHRRIGPGEISRQRLPGLDDMVGDPALEEKVDDGVGARGRNHRRGPQRQPDHRRQADRRPRGEIHDHRQADRNEDGRAIEYGPDPGFVGMTLDDDRQENEQHEQPQGEGRAQCLDPARVAFPHDRQQTRNPLRQWDAILTQESQAVTGDRTQEGLRFMAFATWDAAARYPSNA